VGLRRVILPRCLPCQGRALAQGNLGYMYDTGKGVPQDYAEAMKWYRLAAEQGVAKAQNNLGYMYDKGRGVSQDYVEAVKWYRRKRPKLSQEKPKTRCLSCQIFQYLS
jgi:TPR repeat protein